MANKTVKMKPIEIEKLNKHTKETRKEKAVFIIDNRSKLIEDSKYSIIGDKNELS